VYRTKSRVDPPISPLSLFLSHVIIGFAFAYWELHPYHVTLTWPKKCRQEPSDERFAGPDEQKQHKIALYVVYGIGKGGFMYDWVQLSLTLV